MSQAKFIRICALSIKFVGILVSLLLATPGLAPAQGPRPPVVPGPPTPSRFPVTCPGDSVVVGVSCVDKYEASIWQTTDPNLIAKIKAGTVTRADLLSTGAIQLGVTPGDLEAAGCGDGGNGCLSVYAVSVDSVLPAVATWFQAVATTRNAGRRLATNDEWQAAALGTPDPGAAPGPNDCNTLGPGLESTGSRSNCISDVGTFDMIGNAEEFVAGWVRHALSCDGGWGAFSDDSVCQRGITFTDPPGVRVRGGRAGSGTGAGIYATDNTLTPLSRAGLRGAR